MADILENYFEEGYYTCRFGKIHFMHRSGGGRSMVFLHGLGADTGSWRKLMAYMAGDLDIYLVDLIGHGGSSMPLPGYTAMTQAAALEEFFKGYGIILPCLVGHSYGGWVAALIASSGFPLSGLVLIDSAGLRAKLDDTISSGDLEKTRSLLLKNALATGSNNPASMEAIIGSMDKELLDLPLLANIHLPALIIWGSADPLIAIGYSNYFKEGITGSRLSVVEGAGHSPQYTHPGIVAKYISEFLAGLR